MTADHELSEVPASVGEVSPASASLDRAGTGLRLAVVDGPDGTVTCQVPDDRDDALRLKAQHPEGFWCSTAAVGGCGRQMRIHAGPEVRPYFQHVTDARDCALAHEPSRAERSYEHLRYQQELVEWLAGQCLDGKTEHRMGDDGRADVHVVVDQMHHSIEVQLSRLDATRWAERDEMYRQAMDHVTWLYGVEDGAAAEAAAAWERTQRGVALVLGRDADGVRVGVLGHSETAWSALRDCRLDRDQFWTPHLEQAQEEHRQWQRDRDREAAEAAAVAAGREQAAREQAARERARRSATDAGRWRRTSPPPAAPADRWPGTAECWRDTFPEAEEWIPAQDWRWLVDVDEDRRPLLQFMTFLTQCIYFNGPAAMFDLPDVPDAGVMLDLLQEAQLIERSERSGVRRWHRR